MVPGRDLLNKDATWQLLYSNQGSGSCCRPLMVGGSASPCCRRGLVRYEIALVEHAGRERARLPDVIDDHLTTRHDQLEPPLRIGEDANIL